MKVYTFTELKAIAKDQGYQTAALDNTNGERLLSFNTVKTKDVNQQLAAIEKRLKAEIFPDGFYNVLFALSPHKQKNADVYIIRKGKAEKESLNEPAPPPTVIIEKKEPNVLSWEQALILHKELADLRAENQSLKEKIEDLETQLDEEPEQTSLSDSNSFGSLLKEHAPTLMAIADKFFSLEERKISVEEKKLDLRNANPFTKQQPKQIVIGSKEHLALIEMHYKNGNEEKMNNELNKLKDVNEDLYNSVCEKINELNNTK